MSMCSLESFVFFDNLHVFDKAHGNSFATQAFVLFEIACLLRGGCFRNQNVGRFSCVALTTKAFSASGVKWGRIILTVNQIEAWRLCHCGGVGIFRGGVELSSLLVVVKRLKRANPQSSAGVNRHKRVV